MVSQPKQTNYSPLVGPAAVPAGTVEYGNEEAQSTAPHASRCIERGQERYRIYCTPCHSELGDGHGMVVQRGFPEPPSFHIDRLRAAPAAVFLRCDHKRARRHVLLRRSGRARAIAGRSQPIFARSSAVKMHRLRTCSQRARGPAMRLGRAETSAWLLALVGIVGSAIGWAVRPAEFPHAWLAALTFWIGWPLGSLALIFIHALTGGRWGYAIRRATRDRRCHAAARAAVGTSAAFRAAEALSLDASRDCGASWTIAST